VASIETSPEEQPNLRFSNPAGGRWAIIFNPWRDWAAENALDRLHDKSGARRLRNQKPMKHGQIMKHQLLRLLSR
jgi:hypothetical protein